MSDAKNAWDEVGAKFQGLGLKLKYHLEQEREKEEAAGDQAGRDVRAALEKLAESVDDAFEALGKAAKDPAVREDVSDAGRSLVAALGTSLEQLGDEVRRTMERRKHGGGAADGPSTSGEDDGTATG